MAICTNLRGARERIALTHAEVCERTGIDTAALADFESGALEPRISQIQALARCYCLSFEELLADELPRRAAVRWASTELRELPPPGDGGTGSGRG